MAPELGKRKTNQRQAILASIEGAGRPLTVQEIHDLAAQQSENLGIATVYRTIKLLIESERIKTVSLPDGEARYERAGLGHHHHFQCLECQEVVDLEHCPISIPRGTTFPDGYVVDYHEITLYGTCPSCLNSEDPADADAPRNEIQSAAPTRHSHSASCDHPDHQHHNHRPDKG
jgi:Fur family ferric uptake transcriptional regulator